MAGNLVGYSVAKTAESSAVHSAEKKVVLTAQQMAATRAATKADRSADYWAEQRADSMAAN
jgi:hypothetical protein